MDQLDLIKTNFVLTKPFVDQNDILSVSFKQKPNGEKVGVLTTIYGKTIIKTISPNGLKTETLVEIPLFISNEERNDFIISLYNKNRYTQSEIAMFLGLSQAHVSYILNGKGVKK